MQRSRQGRTTKQVQVSASRKGGEGTRAASRLCQAAYNCIYIYIYRERERESVATGGQCQDCATTDAVEKESQWQLEASDTDSLVKTVTLFLKLCH